jgi:hypothetical protein
MTPLVSIIGKDTLIPTGPQNRATAFPSFALQKTKDLGGRVPEVVSLIGREECLDWVKGATELGRILHVARKQVFCFQ